MALAFYLDQKKSWVNLNTVDSTARVEYILQKEVREVLLVFLHTQPHVSFVGEVRTCKLSLNSAPLKQRKGVAELQIG